MIAMASQITGYSTVLGLIQVDNKENIKALSLIV